MKRCLRPYIYAELVMRVKCSLFFAFKSGEIKFLRGLKFLLLIKKCVIAVLLWIGCQLGELGKLHLQDNSLSFV